MNINHILTGSINNTEQLHICILNISLYSMLMATCLMEMVV